MMKYIHSMLLLCLGLSFCMQGAHAEDFVLSEKNLVSEAYNSPEIDRIELAYLQSEVSYRTTLDQYFLSLDGSLSEEYSNENPAAENGQVRDRGSFTTLDISQPLPQGVRFGVGYASSKTSTLGFSDYSQAKLVSKVSVDLLRDFLGRTSLSELRDTELGVDASKLSKQIDTKVFHLRLRKLFWDYVVAHESKEIAIGMLKSDRKELKLTREKYKIDAADDGDIARLESQIGERQAQNLQFEAAMKQLEEQFKRLLPQLGKRKFTLGNYNKDKRITQFLSCLEIIAGHQTTPLENSLFDELVELKRKQLGFRQRGLDAYSDIDVKLEGQLGIVGSDLGRSDSNDNLVNDPESFASLGIQMTVPLDSKRRDSEQAQLKTVEKQFDAESKELLSRLDSLHLTIVDAITLIKGALENRASNSKHLIVALQDSRTKYRQARITSQQLLQEQDRYFNNELQLISLQRDLIQFMFDYFSLFTETPCELNEDI